QERRGPAPGRRRRGARGGQRVVPHLGAGRGVLRQRCLADDQQAGGHRAPGAEFRPDPRLQLRGIPGLGAQAESRRLPGAVHAEGQAGREQQQEGRGRCQEEGRRRLPHGHKGGAVLHERQVGNERWYFRPPGVVRWPDEVLRVRELPGRHPQARRLHLPPALQPLAPHEEGRGGPGECGQLVKFMVGIFGELEDRLQESDSWRRVVAADANLEWARHIGIYLHPEWYDPLTQDASSKEFQMVVHNRNKSACPPPCGLNGSSLVMAENQGRCKTAVEGDSCYDSVTWAMHDGMDMHPEWYSGLSKNSTFEEFQAAVHRLRPASCPPPCQCYTAVKGEPCYEEVEKETNGKMDPHSRYQAQLMLHRAGRGTCGYPCKEVRPKGSPSLYCFSVVSRFNPEEMRLLERQKSLGASIFDCDDLAVLSTVDVDLGDDVSTLIFPDAAVGVSNAGTAANAELFMNAWE
ncbi:unnamed protein product, partial [Prorocentrum cordatum]